MSNSSSYFDGSGDCLVLCDILSRLPVKSLMRFKCVKKRWEGMISRDPYFIDLQLRSSKTRAENSYVSHTTDLLIHPFNPPTTNLHIPRVFFSTEDLSFDDSQGASSETTLIPSLSCLYFRNDIPVPFGFELSMLDPVYGLVCFVCLSRDSLRAHRDSVLIYNPSTREKTAWIKIRSKSEALECVFRELEENKHLYHRAREFTTHRQIGCQFAFGIDPTTKQHKVLCIYELFYKLTSSASREFNHVEVICDVMTVGENTWRKIDCNNVPLIITTGTYPLHVNGYLYWIMVPGKDNYIVVFDVGSETFSVIIIPKFIHHLLRSNGYRPVANVLVEVDEHITVLVAEGDDLLNLFKYGDNGGVTSANWTKEAIQMPYKWDKIGYLTLKSIAGTDLIVIKCLPWPQDYELHQLRESLHYYSRKKKKYYRNQFEIVLDQSGRDYVAHQISTFFETLLPVQAIQHSEETVTKNTENEMENIYRYF